MNEIHLWGVKQNNLKNIEVKIPLGSFTVVCGPSGSGKSSLAFETLFAEGQRRFIESMSNYARQFLNKAPKPVLDGINNIPPAIAIEQKNSVKSSRSTVGTTTEIIDYLRLFFEKVGKSYCPVHQIPTEKESVTEATDKTLEKLAGQRGYILCEIHETHRVAQGKALQALLIKEGYLRIYVPPAPEKPQKKTKSSRKKQKEVVAPEPVVNSMDLKGLTHEAMGTVIEIDTPEMIKAGIPEERFYLVIDRLAFQAEDRGRIIDSIGQAYDASIKFNRDILVRKAKILSTEGHCLNVSEENSCPICGYVPPVLSSSLFSFNSPVGACPTCKGFGNILDIDEKKVIPNPRLSLAKGALHPFKMPSAAADRRALMSFCKKNKISTDTPWADLPLEQRELIWNGNKEFFGVKGLFEYLEQMKYKMHVRIFVARYRSGFLCKTCHGSRLRPEALNVKAHGKSIDQLCRMTVEDLHNFFQGIRLTRHEAELCDEVLRQLQSRLSFLVRVGVSYLHMDRETRSLSGGEFQRLNLANQLGMGLSQTLYVLDEPTVGLHPRDNDRLISILKDLKNLGNTLVVVEHDHDVIKNSEHVVEMGPGSGFLGGEVLFSGTKDDFFKFSGSNTVQFLQNQKDQGLLDEKRPVDMVPLKYKIEMHGASGFNLKNVDVIFPLNRLVTVTGVSGSGKTTLVTKTLYPALARELDVELIPGQPFKKLTGIEHIKNVVLLDQSAIGKTARSSPVTYLKAFDNIRTLMASTPEAKSRGYTAGTFSLNVDGGRCPVCRGTGYEEIDMQFMDNVIIPCDVCDGKKYRDEILEVSFQGKNVNQILEMTVQEAMDFFVSQPAIRKPLAVLKEVGLDYLRLGQPANTLSGGESQRLKIAKELSQVHQKSTLYILDEPTTGLHFREVALLMKVLNKLIDAGASVILIEHNLDVILGSDYVIDLGPEAGDRGGQITAQGSPREICDNSQSLTGQYLRRYLGLAQ